MLCSKKVAFSNPIPFWGVFLTTPTKTIPMGIARQWVKLRTWHERLIPSGIWVTSAWSGTLRSRHTGNDSRNPRRTRGDYTNDGKGGWSVFFSDHGFFQMLLFFFGNPNTIHGTSLVHFTENPWHGWCVWPGDFFQWSAWLCRDFLVAIPILSGDLHWPYDITKKLPAYVISLSQWLTFKQIGDFIFSRRRKVYKFKLFSWPIGWVGSIRIPPNQSGFHGMSAKIFECCLLLLMAEPG